MPDLTPEERARANQVAAHALSLAVAAREDYLLSVERESPRIAAAARDVIRSVLEDVTTDLPEAFGPLPPSSATLPPTPPAPAPPTPDDAPVPRIEGFELLHVLGQGGMGTVWAAEQREPRRRVAIKVMRAELASKGAVARFHREKQVLGHLSHPHIAKILQAGVATIGHAQCPYFAMEMVDGRVLTRASESPDKQGYVEHHDLDLRARLELFAKLCETADHAHESGIVHRDLKPANILVSEVGGPQVLDFGIARVVDQPIDALGTLTHGGGVGTPSYMSPEQIRGEDIDRRSDVYALGLILYELIAGRIALELPSDAGFWSIAKIICNQEPPPLDRFRGQRVEEDLKLIVQKAIRKEPAGRYETARQLAEDVRRYLDGEPIRARPPSLVYSTRRLVSRHRTEAAALAGLVLVLVAATAVSVSFAISRSRALAQSSAVADLARSVPRDFITNLHPQLKGLPGALTARTELLQTSGRFLEALQQYEHDEEADFHIAAAYIELGSAEGDPFNDSRGDIRAAIATTNKGLSIIETLPVTEQRETLRGQGELQLARLLKVSGESVQARRHAETALEIHERQHDADPTASHTNNLAFALTEVAKSEADLGRTRAAREKLERAVEYGPTVVDSCDRTFLNSCFELFDLLLHQQHVEDCRQLFDKYEEQIDRAIETREPIMLAVRFFALTKRATLLRHEGRTDESLRYYSQALELLRVTSRLDLSNTTAFYRAKVISDHVARVHQVANRYDLALVEFESARADWDMLVEHEPPNLEYRRNLGIAHEQIGRCHAALGQASEANDAFELARSVRTTLMYWEPTNISWCVDYLRLVANWVGAGTAEDARLRALIEDAMNVAQEHIDEGRSDAAFLSELAIVCDRAAMFHLTGKRFESAAAAATRGIELREAAEGPFETARAYCLRAMIRTDHARATEDAVDQESLSRSARKDYAHAIDLLEPLKAAEEMTFEQYRTLVQARMGLTQLGGPLDDG